jgi:hypothetical protein
MSALKPCFNNQSRNSTTNSSAKGFNGQIAFAGGPARLKGGAASNQFNNYASFLLGGADLRLLCAGCVAWLGHHPLNLGRFALSRFPLAAATAAAASSASTSPPVWWSCAASAEPLASRLQSRHAQQRSQILAFSFAGANSFQPAIASLKQGIPALVAPDITKPYTLLAPGYTAQHPASRSQTRLRPHLGFHLAEGITQGIFCPDGICCLAGHGNSPAHRYGQQSEGSYISDISDARTLS